MKMDMTQLFYASIAVVAMLSFVASGVNALIGASAVAGAESTESAPVTGPSDLSLCFLVSARAAPGIEAALIAKAREQVHARAAAVADGRTAHLVRLEIHDLGGARPMSAQGLMESAQSAPGLAPGVQTQTIGVTATLRLQ
ncbi:hypothetical protein J2T57_001451 [Natronocella acetinitrilica]|uniref:DUF541 domain-containing protein n=1 Tax=Natronocella acetinitrilica TaxID=414046 RepID=A0AAE3G2D2_9GAMM|nr:hypothetical protein [Natronocella acetinitrilica]MCP1674349.1 hypothetical protein [Natronocella acetinitrilica]